ncbi:unnamed protein product [Ranitomeya imitator]|uniref:Peptidase S1 domain-containing protein n=1 Tax=Ranitomeya imitator TaxID=111125 RepID=A0ABN9LXR7_9NEOB|nr:unnamed protein product [Ranitomeya imitator]
MKIEAQERKPGEHLGVEHTISLHPIPNFVVSNKLLNESLKIEAHGKENLGNTLEWNTPSLYTPYPICSLMQCSFPLKLLNKLPDYRKLRKGNLIKKFIIKMCSLNNGGCEQYCKVENRDVVCSCTTGYKLGDDGKSCVSSEPYPCGKRTAFRAKRSAPEEKENRKNHIDSSQISIPTNSPGDSAPLNENVQPDSASPKEDVQPESVPPKEDVQPDSVPPKEDVQPDSVPPKEDVQPDSVPLNEAVQPDSVPLNEDVLSELSLYESETFDNPNERIVGGKDCKFGECPWQAVLLSEDNEPFCGGTILSKQFILTAAHCMNQTKYFKVIVGEMNTLKKDGAESIHKVDKIIIHPKFVRLTYDFDIAVVKLKEAINFTDNIIPACLPDPDFAEEVLMNERQAMVSGFGRLHERGAQATKLQKLNVPYVTRQTCKESSRFAITENMFCAGYDKDVKDACQGDSGGPHVTPYKDTYFVTGIVSWGEGCAQQGKYGVYTKVSRLNKWLKGVLKKHHLSPIVEVYL